MRSRAFVALLALIAVVLPWSAAAPPTAVAAEGPTASCAGWLDPYVPPEAIRVARIVDGAVASVDALPFRDYVVRVLAADWPADAPPAALEAAAILVKQAAWYRALHAREGYATVAGACFDVRDDIDARLGEPSAVAPTHAAALDATWSVTLRLTSLAEPFFLPVVREGSAACDDRALSVHPVVSRLGAIACAGAGHDAAGILRRYLGPALAILDVAEIGGPTRYETAVAASRRAVPDGPAPVVFVATGRDYPDALAAGPAAGVLGGSLVLVPGTSIPASVGAELERLRPARIRVLGGPTVVSDPVVEALRAYSPDVARIAGATRYETAAAIAAEAFPGPVATLLVATGRNFPDALAGASAGARLGAPVLLVPGNAPPSGALAVRLSAELARLVPGRILVLGGEGAIDPGTHAWLARFAPQVERLAGPTRYETAAAITAAVYPTGQPRLFVATGDNFPDALAAAPLGGPLLLVPRNGAVPSAGVMAETRRLAPGQIVVLGTGMIVPDATVSLLAGAPTAPASGRLLGPYFGTQLPGSPLLDGAGIPITEDGGVARYNPVQVSQFGLAHHERWIRTGEDADRATFLRMADWLVAAQQPTGLWLYTFAFGPQPVPWWSSMAQGQAISLLARAWQATGEARYRDAASLAVPTMRRLQTANGVAQWDRGAYWLEEYMPPYSRHTLNGFIFSIEGLREWALATGDANAAAWAAEALRTASGWLGRFDTGSWSRYNLAPGTIASLKYHLVVVMQLRHLAFLTRDPVFAVTAARWAGYAERPPAGVNLGGDTTGGPVGAPQ